MEGDKYMVNKNITTKKTKAIGVDSSCDVPPSPQPTTTVFYKQALTWLINPANK